MRDFTESFTKKVDGITNRNLLPMRHICIVCIIIFSCSIGFGLIGYAKKLGESQKKEQNIEKLRNELRYMENLLVEKHELKERLETDTLAIEALARSYGLSRKNEKVFYFVD
jgi:cell division protein FtsB